MYLGSITASNISSAMYTSSATFNLSTPLTSGQTVTATVTPMSGTTSNFATNASLSNPFQVSTGSDNVVGSLRQAILDADAAGGSPTITFTLPTPYQITPVSPLPAITQRAVINGLSLSGFHFGSTMVQLIGSTNDVAGDGLTLAAGSNGSTIEGLDIIGFTNGAAIHVESPEDTIASNELGVTTTGTNGANQYGVLVDDVGQVTIGGTAATANLIGFNSLAGVSISGIAALNNVVAANYIGSDSTADSLPNGTGVVIADSASYNTIGGTAAGAGNTIAFNSGDGVDVDSGTGNAVRGNPIYGNAVPNLNVANTITDAIGAPTGLAYTSVANLITIDFTINGTAGLTYALDFFASSGTKSPAAMYLGSVTATNIPSASYTSSATFNLATPLTSGQTVTATVTPFNNTTSNFATNASFSNPFQVSTGSDSGVGSLRQAILDADAAGGNPTITFTLPAPYQITPVSPLPAITQPLTLDGFVTGTTMAQLIGSTNGVAGNGLILAAGSNGSTIEGLDIVGYQNGAGILVESPDDTLASNELGVIAAGTNGANQVGVLVDNAARHDDRRDRGGLRQRDRIQHHGRRADPGHVRRPTPPMRWSRGIRSGPTPRARLTGQRDRRADLQRGGQHDRRHDRRRQHVGGERDRAFNTNAGIAILSGNGQRGQRPTL